MTEREREREVTGSYVVYPSTRRAEQKGERTCVCVCSFQLANFVVKDRVCVVSQSLTDRMTHASSLSLPSRVGKSCSALNMAGEQQLLVDPQSRFLEMKSLQPYSTTDEYLYAMKEDLADWLSTMYPDWRPITADTFLECLGRLIEFPLRTLNLSLSLSRERCSSLSTCQ